MMKTNATSRFLLAAAGIAILGIVTAVAWKWSGTDRIPDDAAGGHLVVSPRSAGDTAGPGNGPVRSSTRRVRERGPDPLLLAREFHAFKLKMGAGRDIDPFAESDDAILTRIHALDEAGFARFIREVEVACGESGTAPGQILGQVLCIYGDRYPRLVLEHVLRCGTEVTWHPADDPFAENYAPIDAAALALKGWASRDPRQALDWLREHTASFKDRERDELKAGVARGAAEVDMPLAFTMAKEAAGPDDHRALGIIGSFIDPDFEARLEKYTAFVGALQEFIAKMPDGEPRRTALGLFSRVGGFLSGEGFAVGSAWIKAQQLSPVEVSHLFRGMDFLRGDEAKWIDWTRANMPVDIVVKSIAEILPDWTVDDPHGASSWIEKCPPGPERDEALRYFVQVRSTRDMADALRWAEQLPAHIRDELIAEGRLVPPDKESP